MRWDWRVSSLGGFGSGGVSRRVGLGGGGWGGSPATVLGGFITVVALVLGFAARPTEAAMKAYSTRDEVAVFANNVSKLQS